MSYINIISGIYSIKNNINNKIYIGQSTNVYCRWSSHRSRLRKNKHGNIHLQNAWNKYGEDNFTFSILKICTELELDNFEKYYIDYYNSLDMNYGYNLQSGGNECKKLSLETIEKIKKNRHYICSDKTKKLLSEIQTGKTLSQEHKDKISQHHKKAIAEGTMKPKTEHFERYNELQKKSINCYNKNGFYKKYDCIHDCARDLNLLATNVCKVLKGKYKTSGEYTFTYSNELLSDNELQKRFTRNYPTNIIKSRVAQIDEYGNIISIFNNIKEASLELKVDASSISKVCKGKLKSTKGYNFKYYN